MQKLFDIDGGKVVMNPTILWLPEFKKIWDRDKSKGKEVAAREISYIVFLHSFQSPYQAYSEADRESKIISDFFKEGWKPDDCVKAGIKKYLELQDSAVLRLFNSTKLALEAINVHFKRVYNKVVESEDDMDIDIDKLVKNAERLGNLVQSLEKLKVQVQKEQLDNTSIRGGQGVGMFEI